MTKEKICSADQWRNAQAIYSASWEVDGCIMTCFIYMDFEHSFADEKILYLN